MTLISDSPGRKQTFSVAFAVGIIFFATSVSNAASRISGIYVNHGSTFAEMLQLTQTENGQISGVFSSVQLKADGKVSSEQVPVTGAVDADQLTLTAHSFLSFLTGTNIAGMIKGNGIRLQTVDSKGNVASPLFVRSSADQFKVYADALKSKGDGIVLTRKLLNGAQEFRQTVHNVENWIANAELLSQRIPIVKSQYEKIEDRMRSLIAQERATHDPVARMQISVAVTQGDIAGGQRDIEVNQIWDFGIGSSGSDLHKQFTDWDGNCSRAEQLEGRGATAQASEAWESACQAALAERAKFAPMYKRIIEQRAELKSFQSLAESHRKALVDEANRISYSR